MFNAKSTRKPKVVGKTSNLTSSILKVFLFLSAEALFDFVVHNRRDKASEINAE